jgi:protein tyrosine phosphatase (PTP) superfamily phosphohydrolase (DUF442 family)
MPSNEDTTGNQRGKNKPLRLRNVVAVGAILAAGSSVYLIHNSVGIKNTVTLNRSRATIAESPAQAKWAQPVELLGVPNLHKVSDRLYRGAQPTAEGLLELKKLGIKTIINLRSSHSYSNEIQNSGLSYESISMTTSHPETDDVIRFLKIVTDENRTPVYVHCQRGADRTGTMCAIYRIIVQNWSKQEATEEMTKGGFGFYKGYQNLVKYIQNLDVDQIRQQARPAETISSD